MLVPMVSHDHKSHVVPHFDNLDLRYVVLPLTMLPTSHGADSKAMTLHDNNTNGSDHVIPMLMPIASHHKMSHAAHHFSCLNLGNAVVPLMILLASCDTDASANGIKWPTSHVGWNCTIFMPLASCEASASANSIKWSKEHVASHFILTIYNANGITWPKKSCCILFIYHPELTPAVVSLTMPSASHAANASTQCSTRPKSHLVPHFNYLDLTNEVVPLMILLASPDDDAGANGITEWKKWCHISCWSSWPNKWNGAIADTVGIIWHWNQYQWNHMSKKVMLHIVSGFMI